MKTLHLNLKKKWFDMILSGEKIEEYREITPYWAARLLLYEGEKQKQDFWYMMPIEFSLSTLEFHKNITFKNTDTIIFSNGYAKDRRQFKIKIEKLSIEMGLIYWGAKAQKIYFTFRLGKILEANNISDFMTAEGLGPEDMINDITMPQER